MQFKKTPKARRKLYDWARRRKHLVCQLLDANPKMLRREALEIANRRMRNR